MLYRVSCKACHLSSIWTDDPRSFLSTVCLRYRHCEAKLAAEAFASARKIRATTQADAGALASVARPRSVRRFATS
jgi:hypothetical protein